MTPSEATATSVNELEPIEVLVTVIGNTHTTEPANIHIPWQAGAVIRWTIAGGNFVNPGIVFESANAPFAPMSCNERICEMHVTNDLGNQAGGYAYDVVYEERTTERTYDPTVELESPPPGCSPSDPR
jgi:hypothetical protein